MGIFRAGANITAFSTAGIERMRIDATGNVGIGTTAPSEKLEVVGAIYSKPSPYNYGNIFVTDSAGNKRLALGVSAVLQNATILQSAGGGIVLRSSDSVPQVMITEGGNVGIGTTSPLKKLDVVGDINATQAIYSITGYYIGINQVIDSSRNADFASLKIGGTTVIDASRNIINVNWVNATNLNASSTIRASQICIGNDCRNVWPSFSESDPYWNANISAISANYLIKRSGSGIGQSIIYDSGSNVGIGTTNPQAKLEINGGIRLNTTSTRPTCDENQRGTLWFEKAVVSNKDDLLWVCMRNSTGSYIWVLVARGG